MDQLLLAGSASVADRGRLGSHPESGHLMATRNPTEMARKAFRFVVCLALSVTGLLALAWAWDLHNDRKHILLVNRQTSIFTKDGDQICYGEGERLTPINLGARLKVCRIRYWKDCATVCITLPDGRKGYVVLGGGVSLSPKLSN
jgi:hypothetical protein